MKSPSEKYTRSRLADLVSELPRDLDSEWKDSRRYSLSGGKSRWLDMERLLIPYVSVSLHERTEGHRLGLLIDIAVECRKLLNHGKL